MSELEPTMDDLLYKKTLGIMAKKNSTLVFDNESHSNANAVISTMLKHSNKSFLLFDGNWGDKNAPFGNEVYNEMDIFLEHPNAKMQIVVDNLSKNKNSRDLYKWAFDRLNKKGLSLYNIPEGDNQFIDAIKNEFNKPIYYALGDEKSYRIEEISKSNNENSEAIGCFNDDEGLAKRLINVFEENKIFLTKITT